MAWLTILLNILWQRAFSILLLAVYGLSAWLLYHLMGYAPQQSWNIPVEYCSGVQFSQDRKSLLVRSHDWLQVWDVPTSKIRWEQRFEKAETYPLYYSEALSPDGSLVSYRLSRHAPNTPDHCFVVDTISGSNLLSFQQGYDPWWEDRLCFTRDGRTIFYRETIDSQSSRYVVWDVPSQKVRFTLSADNFALACIGYHPSQGHLIALLDNTNKRVELWDIATGHLWKSISISHTPANTSPNVMWFSTNGKEVFLVAPHFRDEQVKLTLCTATTVTACMTASNALPYSVALAMNPRAMEYDLLFIFNGGATADHYITCLETELERIKYADFMSYPAHAAKACFLLRRKHQEKINDVTKQSVAEIFDLENNQMLSQVPVKGVSHQIDRLSHNADAGEDFHIEVVPQNNTVVVAHYEYRKQSNWDRFRDWLGDWVPAVKVTNNRIENDYDIQFYDAATSQLTASLEQRRFNCFSEDGQALATAMSLKNSTLIEIWDWPLRRPWFRILGWPVLLIVSIVILRWLARVRSNRVLRQRNPRLV